MAVTPVGVVVEAAADTPAWGTALSGLASGTSSLSDPIDNTEATLGHAPFDYAEAWIILPGSITTGAGSPYIQAAVVASLDGTSYEASGVSGGQVYPIPGSGTEPLLPTTAISVVRVKGLILPPSLFRVLLLNEAGAAFAATTTATIYRMQGGIG